MRFIVATNVITSRPPESQPTGTPHAHAKNNKYNERHHLDNMRGKDNELSVGWFFKYLSLQW